MTTICRQFPVLVLLALLTAASAPAQAGEAVVRAGPGFFSVPVTSVKEGRFQTVIKQRYDYSCGSAAVASLLTFHYEQPVTEKEVFLEMYEAGDKEQIRKAGFSLLDMKNYLKSHGVRADGFKVGLDKFAKAGVPAITLIETNGYRHFVIIKGANDNEILVGDPALGVKIYKRAEFEAIWKGIIFVIRDRIKVAQSHFNEQRDWRVRQKAPFGTALTRDSLGMFTLMLPASNEF